MVRRQGGAGQGFAYKLQCIEQRLANGVVHCLAFAGVCTSALRTDTNPTAPSSTLQRPGVAGLLWGAVARGITSGVLNGPSLKFVCVLD